MRLPRRSAAAWLLARMEERGFSAAIDRAGTVAGVMGEGPRQVVLQGPLAAPPPLAAFTAAATAPVAGLRVTVVAGVEAPPPPRGTWSIAGAASSWDHVFAPRERDPAADAIVAAIAALGGTAAVELRDGPVTYGVGGARFARTPFGDEALEEYAASIAVLRDVLRRAAAA